MVLSFRRFSWLWFKGKDKDQVLNNSSVNPSNPLTEWASALRGEPETPEISPAKRDSRKLPSSSSKAKRKWKSGEHRNKRIDKECNVVLVPSSGSESDDLDWSIGWLEPHAPEFMTDEDDDKADDSFAVLVPCYRHRDRREPKGNVQQVPIVEFLSAGTNLPSDDSSGATYHMKRWLTSHY